MNRTLRDEYRARLHSALRAIPQDDPMAQVHALAAAAVDVVADALAQFPAQPIDEVEADDGPDAPGSP